MPMKAEEIQAQGGRLLSVEEHQRRDRENNETTRALDELVADGKVEAWLLQDGTVVYMLASENN